MVKVIGHSSKYMTISSGLDAVDWLKSKSEVGKAIYGTVAKKQT